MEPDELRQLREETERAAQALGQVRYGPTVSELKSLVFRRSLYIARDVAAGELLTHSNIRCVRPGHGLPPKYVSHVIGRRAARATSAGTPVSWDLLA